MCAWNIVYIIILLISVDAPVASAVVIVGSYLSKCGRPSKAKLHSYTVGCNGILYHYDVKGIKGNKIAKPGVCDRKGKDLQATVTSSAIIS